MTDADIQGLFVGSTGPGVTTSGRYYRTTFLYRGKVYAADMDGQAAFFALSAAVGAGIPVDAAILCYMRFRCSGTISSTIGSSGQTIHNFKSVYGGVYKFETRVLKYSPSDPNSQYYISQTSPGGNAWGFAGLFDPFVSSCGGGLGDSGSPSFATEGDARDHVSNKVSGGHASWVIRAPGCVNFDVFIGKSTGSGQSVMQSVLRARDANENPLNYFSVTGLTVTDDTYVAPPPPPDRDGDGVPDSSDPAPDDPTIPGSEPPPPPPPDPSTDPTQEADYETNCRIINLFCWARWAFTPQVDWSTEFGNLRASMMQSVPFGYVGWLTQLASSGGASSIPSISMAGVTMDISSSPVLQWWANTGRYWLLSLFYVGFFGWVIRAVLL
jgi:hypothetical protein